MNTVWVCHAQVLSSVYYTLAFKYLLLNAYIFTINFLTLFLADQDSVRLLAVEGCAALGKLLEPQDCVAHILPVIVNFSQVYWYWALIIWSGKICILYPLACWFTDICVALYLSSILFWGQHNEGMSYLLHLGLLFS